MIIYSVEYALKHEGIQSYTLHKTREEALERVQGLMTFVKDNFMETFTQVRADFLESAYHEIYIEEFLL